MQVSVNLKNILISEILKNKTRFLEFRVMQKRLFHILLRNFIILSLITQHFFLTVYKIFKF